MQVLGNQQVNSFQWIAAKPTDTPDGQASKTGKYVHFSFGTDENLGASNLSTTCNFCPTSVFLLDACRLVVSETVLVNCFLWWETDSTRNPFSRATLCQATLPSGNTIVLRALMRSKSLDSTTCFLFSVAGRLREANVARKNYGGQVRENTHENMSTLFSHLFCKSHAAASSSEVKAAGT